MWFTQTRLAVALVAALVVGCAGVWMPTPSWTESPAAPASPTPAVVEPPTPTPSPGPTPTPTPTPAPTPEALTADLDFGGEQRLAPADGQARVEVSARVQLDGGGSAAGRLVHLRPVIGDDITAVEPVQPVGADGSLSFALTAGAPGVHELGLYDAAGWSGDQPLATIEVEFTRKVVLLAPGFQSALAKRYLTFGEPGECGQPTVPRSITEALICLGFEPDVTIVDMAWEPAPCRPADAERDPPRADCVATIRPTDEGTDVTWQPADYDLADLGLSLLRQQQIDLWGHRLARTFVTYNEELRDVRGSRASFYLVGHSLGGQVVLRALHAIVADEALRVHFAGDNRGLLPAVVSVDGALNWAGQVELIGEPRCGLPVRTLPDAGRAHDNAAVVGQANELLGTTTVAMTSATDPIVTPDVALLRDPVPVRGYLEELHHADGPEGGCSHSALLWPEPTGFPLREVFEEHIGRAAGEWARRSGRPPATRRAWSARCA